MPELDPEGDGDVIEEALTGTETDFGAEEPDGDGGVGEEAPTGTETDFEHDTRFADNVPSFFCNNK